MNLSRFSACQCTHRHTHLEEVFFVVVVEIKDKSKAKILPILQPLSKRFVPASLLKHVEKKAALSRLLKAERQNKLKFLIHLVNVYEYLLYCLFNEI